MAWSSEWMGSWGCSNGKRRRSTCQGCCWSSIRKGLPNLQAVVRSSGSDFLGARIPGDTLDGASMALERADLNACSDVPETDGFVMGGGGETSAVAGEADAGEGLDVAVEDDDEGAGGGVPEADGAVDGAGDELGGAAGPVQRQHGAAVAGQLLGQHAGGVPDVGAAVPGSRGQHLAAGAEDDLGEPVLVLLEHVALESLGRVPQPQGAVAGGGGDLRAVGRPSSPLDGARVAGQHLEGLPGPVPCLEVPEDGGVVVRGGEQRLEAGGNLDAVDGGSTVAGKGDQRGGGQSGHADLAVLGAAG